MHGASRADRLLGVQHRDRVHAGRAAGRKIGGQDAHEADSQSDDSVRGRVHCIHVEEKVLDGPTRLPRDQQTQCDPSGSEAGAAKLVKANAIVATSVAGGTVAPDSSY